MPCIHDRQLFEKHQKQFAMYKQPKPLIPSIGSMVFTPASLDKGCTPNKIILSLPSTGCNDVDCSVCHNHNLFALDSLGEVDISFRVSKAVLHYCNRKLPLLFERVPCSVRAAQQVESVRHGGLQRDFVERHCN